MEGRRTFPTSTIPATVPGPQVSQDKAAIGAVPFGDVINASPRILRLRECYFSLCCTLGMVDNDLYPYYKRDNENSETSEQKIQELLDGGFRVTAQVKFHN